MTTKILFASVVLFAAATVHADDVISGVIYCAPQLDFEEPGGQVVEKMECANAPSGPGSQDNGSWQAPFTDRDVNNGIAITHATYGGNCHPALYGT
jgi:hypothetical protein